MQLLTERLFLIPLQPDGMRALLARTSDPELVGPYTEMLTLSLRHPEQWIWYTAWGLYQNDSGDFVGDLCFKGLPKNGQPEIGYGISPEFQGQGYATEAVRAAYAAADEISFEKLHRRSDIGARALACRSGAEE